MVHTIPNCLHGAEIVSLAAGTRIFQAGDRCEQFFYLLSGQVRVDLVSRAGKPVTLYRFGADETCILTTSGLMCGDLYNAEAMVEEAVTACVIPRPRFETLLNISADFRALVFASFAQRLAAMMAKVDEIACLSIDQRLASCLLGLANGNQQVLATHAKLAADVGTAREVISRKLADFEKRGWVKRGRACLLILQPEKLKRLTLHGD